jgi:general secretion pathway protein A
LLGAYATSRATVDRKTVDRAGDEVFGPRSVAPPVRQKTALVLGLGLAMGVGIYAAAMRVTSVDEAAKPVVKPVAKTAAVKAPVVAPRIVVDTSPPKLLSDANEAWRELAAAWKVGTIDGEPCAALAKQQLQCFTKTLNLALIRELGRPGIVTLDAQQGTPSYALLTKLTRDTATLRAAGTEQTVTLDALAARWQGEFATIWKAPPGYSPRETKSETLAWIAAKLGVPNDAQLKSKLRAFQLAHGLQADGLPGPMTFMQLDRAGGADEPRLATSP